MIRDVVLSKMGELRVACDEAETMTAKKYWPFILISAQLQKIPYALSASVHSFHPAGAAYNPV